MLRSCATSKPTVNDEDLVKLQKFTEDFGQEGWRKRRSAWCGRIDHTREPTAMLFSCYSVMWSSVSLVCSHLSSRLFITNTHFCIHVISLYLSLGSPFFFPLKIRINWVLYIHPNVSVMPCLCRLYLFVSIQLIASFLFLSSVCVKLQPHYFIIVIIQDELCSALC